MPRLVVCTRCRNVVTPVMKTPGTFGVELALWLLICIPGIVYSVWRATSKHEACPICGARELVPADSPGAAAIAPLGAIEQARALPAPAPQAKTYVSPSVGLTIGIVVVVIYIASIASHACSTP
jgi:hypothetical protein